MMSLDMTAYDLDKARDGVWHDIRGGKFKIAYLSDSAAERIEKIERDGKHRGESQIDITWKQCDALAEEVMRDWQEVDGKDQHGNTVDIPFSVEAAKQLLKMELELSADVLRRSRLSHHFRKEGGK